MDIVHVQTLNFRFPMYSIKYSDTTTHAINGSSNLLNVLFFVLAYFSLFCLFETFWFGP